MVSRRWRSEGGPFMALLCLPCRLLVSASQDGKLIVWDSYTTNKVTSAT